MSAVTVVAEGGRQNEVRHHDMNSYRNTRDQFSVVIKLVAETRSRASGYGQRKFVQEDPAAFGLLWKVKGGPLKAMLALQDHSNDRICILLYFELYHVKLLICADSALMTLLTRHQHK